MAIMVKYAVRSYTYPDGKVWFVAKEEFDSKTGLVYGHEQVSENYLSRVLAEAEMTILAGKDDSTPWWEQDN